MQEMNHEKVKEAFQKVKTDFSEIRRALHKTSSAVESFQTTVTNNKKELENSIANTYKSSQKAFEAHKINVSKRFDTVTDIHKSLAKLTQSDLAELEKRVLAKFDAHTNKAIADHKTTLSGIDTNRKDISQLDTNIQNVKTHIEKVLSKDVHNEKYLKTIVKKEERLDKNNETTTRLVQSLRKQKDIMLQNRKDVGKLTTSVIRTDKKVEDLTTALDEAKLAYKAHIQNATKNQNISDIEHKKFEKHVAKYEKDAQVHADEHTKQKQVHADNTKNKVEQDKTIAQLDKRMAQLEKQVAKQKQVVIQSPKSPKKETKVVKVNPQKEKKVKKSNGKGFLFNLFFEEVEEAPKKETKTKKISKKKTANKSTKQ